MTKTPVRMSAEFIRCLGVDGRELCRARLQCARHLAIEWDQQIRRGSAHLCEAGEYLYFIQVTGDTHAA